MGAAAVAPVIIYISYCKIGDITQSRTDRGVKSGGFLHCPSMRWRFTKEQAGSGGTIQISSQTSQAAIKHHLHYAEVRVASASAGCLLPVS